MKSNLFFAKVANSVMIRYPIQKRKKENVLTPIDYLFFGRRCLSVPLESYHPE